MKTKPDHMALLKQALWSQSVKDARARELLAALTSRDVHSPLCFSAADIEYICAVLVKELTTTGLGPDSEPTERGLEIEGAIDWVRRKVKQGLKQGSESTFE